MEDLRTQAIQEAMFEAELDRDFLRTLCTDWIDKLSPEDLADYLGME
jgi:hypothetical protein